MDSNVNTGPVNPAPNPPPQPHDIAEPGPIDPATGQPNHGAEVSSLKSWFRENTISLVISAAVIAAVCIWLDPIDTLKVVIGLGLVIFIHELGHFLAAKWCDVHVRTFSIGFGPAVPFCSYKWGETTYMLGIIPLGGYVAMVGEGEGAENEEEGEEDPRSFRKKTVGQRMLIISAGVVMNIILGMGCFVAAYLHGVQEKPATVGSIESGSAAWKADMRTGDHIMEIDGRKNPWFDDVRPIVMSSDKGEQIPIQWERNGQLMPATTVSPTRDEGQRFPQLGIAPPYELKLVSGNKQKITPFLPSTPAAEATSADGKEKFEPGDRVIGMTDPQTKAVTPVADYTEYYRRMVLLREQNVTFLVQRKDSDQTAEVIVKPAYRHDLGMRMRMGEVVALRQDGPAKKAGVIARPGNEQHGDRIKAVMLPPNKDGKLVWYVAGPVDWAKKEFETPDRSKVEVKPLNPLMLPDQLSEWAAGKNEKLAVELVVIRHAHPTEVAVRLPIEYDPSFRFDREIATLPNSPMPLSGLGLAYWVEAVVDEVTPGGPAANAKTTSGELPSGFFPRVKRFFGLEGGDVAPGGEAMPLQLNDVIIAVRFKATDGDGNLKAGSWQDGLESQQWASVDSVYQMSSPELDLRVKRGDEVISVTIKGNPNPQWGMDERGLRFQQEVRIQQAAGVGDAIRLGALRTVRFIKSVYMSLYGYIKGRISVKTLSGPLTIANVSYRLAGEDFWQFLLFLGLISVNLAVVNFLPIPVLDGGHMVFLILEKILGRPVPERMFAIFMYFGLFIILALMVFVISLDVGRLFFGIF